MDLVIRTKGIDPSDALNQYIRKKLARLERFVEGIGEVQVMMRLERGRHVVEVTIPLDHLVLRAEEHTGDMYSSVDLVMDKLERQIVRHKSRLVKRLRGIVLRDMPEVSLKEEAEDEVIARVKRFPIKPMPVEEAILQMNLLGHSFFVFANSETERVNVVYRRNDGQYGLLEPEA